LAASFQHTINEILKVKSKKAMELFVNNNKKNKENYFVIAGGVASNKTIRKTLQQVCEENNFIDDVTFTARPRWPLDEKAPFLKGAGVDHS
jgi:N6-L-threonylcarbamoyladenine synthase